MRSLESEQFHARSLVYHALAEALSEPVAELHPLLLEATTKGAQTLGSPACRKAALSLATLPAPTAAELRQRYIRVTRNSARRPLALYGSLHREGRLMGQSAAAAEDRYRALGIVPDNGELPDHASVELAFMGHLAAAQASAYIAIDSLLVSRLGVEEHTFLREHPGVWLPDVGRELAAADDPFYAVVGVLLSEFLTEKLGSAWYRQARRAGFPVLQETDVCNLCGICIGACLPGALRMVESDTETALSLDISRCVGCNRCVRICPQRVLKQLETDVLDAQHETNGASRIRILRRSPRAQCPICGRPTVSEAELEAVFATLQPDPMLKRQMSLCVECKSLWNSL
ncbi:MAG: molecular chaperone TorD family protein [Chloroflexi bacterium]|nr:molecular chaperone TorD family protein [Chloroflexota bacterium]